MASHARTAGLLLLHGLGATHEVWRGVQELLGGRPSIAPDLPGHGRAARLPSYSFDDHAATLQPLLPTAGETWVLGHSMGGMVGLALAARCPAVTRVVAFGVKVAWSPEDLEGAARQAGRPARTFATREEAVERYLRLAGLTGLLSPSDPSAAAGVTETDGGWQVAQDPATFGFGTPDIRGLLESVSCHVVLARGEHDLMVSDADLRARPDAPVALAGLGHNAHVEDPAAVLRLL